MSKTPEEIKEETLSQIGLSKANRVKHERLYSNNNPLAQSEEENLPMSKEETLKEEILAQIGLSKKNRKKLGELYGNKNPKFFGNKPDSLK